MDSTQLIIATGNTHKVAEFEKMLTGISFSVHSAKICGGMPVVEENGGSFAANAQIKAEALHKVAPAGAWVLADDSGLEVDALEGAPGIYSARYAGENASDADNVNKLLQALEQIPHNKRTARFRCVLCLIDDQGHVTHYNGDCEGHIAKTSKGDSGFGYDPIFIPEGQTQSFATLGENVKSAMSHRARAVAFLKELLKGI
ncbi:MAG: XTP/dITP diphosphohydrolase [Lentimonas sp.]|jgi:XTP/dITP diphosphohydrolase